MRRRIEMGLVGLLVGAICTAGRAQLPEGTSVLRVGIIGLDTSHAEAFAKEINAPAAPAALAGLRVTAAYPPGSRDIASSVSRVPGYTEALRAMGIAIVPTLDDLVAQVDAVLLETNDGRPPLEQALVVLRARKPLFIDKPLAGSLTDAVAIFLAAEHFQSPVFTSSALRFVPAAQQARQGAAGDVLGCDTYSPCTLEPTHPDLYWYGIHGVELLFAVMGTGCQQVQRVSTPSTDLVVGLWEGGRVGTFRGTRPPVQGGYGGTVFGSSQTLDLGSFTGYQPLVLAIGEFFRSGRVPVAPQETLELFAFMTAADQSKQQGGVVVQLEPLLREARVAAVQRLRELGVTVGE